MLAEAASVGENNRMVVRHHTRHYQFHCGGKMSVKTPLLTVGIDQYGDIDFGVSMLIATIAPDRMMELRAMITVAIGSMEDNYRVHGYPSRANTGGQQAKQIDPGKGVPAFGSDVG
jgi:hypothetical protein